MPSDTTPPERPDVERYLTVARGYARSVSMHPEQLAALARWVLHVEGERDEARRKTAGEIIASLSPVGPLTNAMPSRHLSLVEEYIAKEFGLTDDDITEVFEIEYKRRRWRQEREDKLRAVERERDEARAALAQAKVYFTTKDGNVFDDLTTAQSERDEARAALAKAEREINIWKRDRNMLLDRVLAVCEALGIDTDDGAGEYAIPEADALAEMIELLTKDEEV